jgi:hypothetical protein
MVATLPMTAYPLFWRLPGNNQNGNDFGNMSGLHMIPKGLFIVSSATFITPAETMSITRKSKNEGEARNVPRRMALAFA